MIFNAVVHVSFATWPLASCIPLHTFKLVWNIGQRGNVLSLQCVGIHQCSTSWTVFYMSKTYPLSFFHQVLYSCNSCFRVGVFFSFVLPLLYYNAIQYFLFCSVVCSFTFLCVVVLTPAVLIGLVGIKYLILKYVRKSCHIAQCHCLNILHLLLSCVSTLCCILVLCAHSDLTYQHSGKEKKSRAFLESISNNY